MAVFLSYHKGRIETVEHVATYLSRHQIDSWYAPRDIPPGAVWGQAIANAISHSDALVLLFDSSADTSKHVQREVDLADRVHIPIYWLRLEDIEPNELNYYLGTIQWIDWLDKRDEALDRLVRTLSRTIEPPSSPTAYAQPAEPAEASRRTDRFEPQPYVEWEPRQLVEVDPDSVEEIIEGLVEIVNVEGPILSRRLNRLYVKAAGGRRVGSNIETILERAADRAVRNGRLARLKDRLRQPDKTLYMPGTAPIVPRVLGPRELDEVPKSEIRELASHLQVSSDSDEAIRTIADCLGIRRVSDAAAGYMRASLAYRYDAVSSAAVEEGGRESHLSDRSISSSVVPPHGETLPPEQPGSDSPRTGVGSRRKGLRLSWKRNFDGDVDEAIAPWGTYTKRQDQPDETGFYFSTFTDLEGVETTLYRGPKSSATYDACIAHKNMMIDRGGH